MNSPFLSQLLEELKMVPSIAWCILAFIIAVCTLGMSGTLGLIIGGAIVYHVINSYGR